MFKFFVNTKILNICKCTHIVPTFLQCDAMICKRDFANWVMYQCITIILICMDLQNCGKKWCDYLHQNRPDHRSGLFLLYMARSSHSITISGYRCSTTLQRSVCSIYIDEPTDASLASPFSRLAISVGSMMGARLQELTKGPENSDFMYPLRAGGQAEGRTSELTQENPPTRPHKNLFHHL